MKRPQPEEYSTFHKTYIDKVEDDVLYLLTDQLNNFPKFLRSIPAEKADYAYGEGKWTLRELLGHIIDTERILSYRLLCVARNDATALPGFEEDDYVKNAHFADQDFGTLIEEFKAVRTANLFLFRSLNEDDLNRVGMVNNNSLSARALLFIIAGHLKHHEGVIKERYLSA